MSVTIWHNPRCSKSRATMELLQECGIEPETRLYLDTPPSAAEIDRILTLLGKSPRDIMRKNETPYRELDLGNPGKTRAELIDAMVANPILIERPIVTSGERAAIGRPPESVLEIL